MHHRVFLARASVEAADRTGRTSGPDDCPRLAALPFKPHEDRGRITDSAPHFVMGWRDRSAQDYSFAATLILRSVAALQRLSRGRRRRQEIERLESYGPDLLKDLGVSRAEIIREERRSLWDLGREGSGW